MKALLSLVLSVLMVLSLPTVSFARTDSFETGKEVSGQTTGEDGFISSESEEEALHDNIESPDTDSGNESLGIIDGDNPPGLDALGRPIGDALGSDEPAPVGDEPAAGQASPGAPGERLLPDGEYTVRSADDPYRVLDVMGGSADSGANLALYRLSGVRWQRFALVWDGEGYYAVSSCPSGMALTAEGGAGEPGNVFQAPADGSDAQLWALVDAGEGRLGLVSKGTGLRLDVEGGRAGDSVNVRTWPETANNSGLGQAFSFEAAPSWCVDEGAYAVECADDPLQVLDVMGSSTAPGANLALYSNLNSPNQRLRLERAGDDGWYRLVAGHSGQALDVVASGTEAGTNVTQWPLTGAGNQLWAVEPAGDGWYRLRAGCSGLCLDVEGGRAGDSVNVRTWPETANNSGLGQMFRFQRMLDDGVYYVGSADDPACVLDVVAGSREDGANVTLWRRTGASNQRFEVRHLYGRAYKVSCCRSWRALDVVAGGAADGTNVTQWSQYDCANQSWVADVQADGSVMFRSECSGLYLDVEGGHAAPGVNVQTWEATQNNGGAGQRWILEKTSFKEPGAYQRSDGSWDWYNSDGDWDRDGAISTILLTANSLLGVPYVWLGVYPQDGGMDCASFTWYLYRQLGIDIGFETYDQMYSGVPVWSLSDAKPGDLVLMYDNGWPNYVPGLFEHVVLYAGNGMIYEEPTFGGQCQYVSIWSKGMGNISIRRILGD